MLMYLYRSAASLDKWHCLMYFCIMNGKSLLNGRIFHNLFVL